MEDKYSSVFESIGGGSVFRVRVTEKCIAETCELLNLDKAEYVVLEVGNRTHIGVKGGMVNVIVADYKGSRNGMIVLHKIVQFLKKERGAKNEK